ncbi:hypothetical protein LVJ59_15180 [Microbacterium sp. KKR3/1]|uniref:hypothetical protein n=1 Tax=Microbacterium sp. KKR3/1 TaxID=2904241 RepID=UPI001E323086|nr:hypothetical protein [Microbacterium sp. KKR3/1]MCE0510391.1 hypothetical protein [Microbacterium sp. KKR3/1]
MLAWETLTQPDFDRTVELLVRRWYARNHPEYTVQAIDGRGGDGGIDIDVHETATGKLVKIYQLKFFPEGFSGGFGTRKKQIRKSFDQAAKLHPPVWALVIPRNFTINERKWITLLLNGTGIRPAFVGRTELDDFQASDPEAISLSERSAERRALALVGREQAALLNLGNVAAEVARLAARADTLSPHWGIDIAARGESITQTVFAKHPDAHVREPLSITFGLNFADQPGLRAEFDTAMRYGVIEQLTLPPGVVERFERIGPDWFAERFGAGTLELHPTPANKVELPATLRVTASSGPPRVLRGIATWMTRGTEGAQVQTVFGGGLTITWRFAEDRRIGASSEMTFSPVGHSGIDVDRSVRLLDAVYEGAQVVLEVDGRKESLTVEPQTETGVAREAAELANDLAAIEHLTGTQFAFPNDMGGPERVMVRVVRLILEGECVLAPDMDGANFVFSGEIDEGIERLLDGPVALAATTSGWTANICGEVVQVSDVRYYHPGVRVLDSAQHLAALRAGTGAGREARAVPDDATQGFRIYSPSRFKHEVVTAVPWGLTGIDEHPGFEQARAVEA